MWLRPVPDRPNTARYARFLFLSRTEHVHFITRQDCSIPESIEANLVSVVRPPFGTIQPPAVDQVLHLLWVAGILARLRVRQGVRLFYSTWHPWVLVLFLVRFIFNARIIVDVWDDPGLALALHRQSHRGSGAVTLALRAHYLLLRLLLRRSDLVVCAVEPAMIRTFRIPPQKMIHITNGVDLGYVQSLASPQANPVEIFYCGTPTPARGMNLLLDAFRSVGPVLNAELVVAGDMTGSEREDFDRMVAARGLTSRVDILGEVSSDQIIRCTYRATVCVCPFPDSPELSGIYPIKIPQYLAAGRAVVSTNLPGIRRLTNNGEDAWLVEPDDGGMANAMATLLTDDVRRRTLEARALSRARELDWNVVQLPITTAIRNLR